MLVLFIIVVLLAISGGGWGYTRYRAGADVSPLAVVLLVVTFLFLMRPIG